MKVGVIGTNWGRMHVGAFRAAGAEVVALCGHSLERAREVAQAEHIPLATTDVDALCEAVELVVVASPDALHATHVEAAWRHHRSVLCEKPLCFGAEAASALADRARQLATQGIHSHLNFPYRALPPLRALKEWLGERQPEQLVVTVRNGFVPRGAPGGELLPRTGSADFGGASHVLDAALWLTGGAPRWVQAVCTGTPVHSLGLQVGLSSGATLHLQHLASPEPGLHGGWSLLGDGWEVGFSAGYVPARQGWCLSSVRGFIHGRWQDVAQALEPTPGLPEPWAQAHVDAARTLVQALESGRPAPLPTFEDGARVQRLVDAALSSHAEGRRVPLE